MAVIVITGISFVPGTLLKPWQRRVTEKHVDSGSRLLGVSAVPLSIEITAQDPQRCFIYCVFSYKYLPMVKFSLLIRHGKVYFCSFHLIILFCDWLEVTGTTEIEIDIIEYIFIYVLYIIYI